MVTDTDVELPQIPVDILRRQGDLASETIAGVRERFAGYHEHAPAEAFYDGMTEIAKVIQGMADPASGLSPNFYISTLPCGVGKTTTVEEGVRALTRREEYKDVGVVIFIEQINEIVKLVKAMGLSEKDYSVIVSDRSIKDRRAQELPDIKTGNPTPVAAQVLITTQAMLDARLKGVSTFADIKEFHYHGKPREVRIWDECLTPSAHLTVTENDIAELYKHLNPLNPDVVTDLKALVREMQDAKVGDILEIPESVRLLPKDADYRPAWDVLHTLAGLPMRVRPDPYEATALSYSDNFPKDMGPLLILDGSGPYRQVYKDWAEYRKNLQRLPSHSKNYSGLTIRHWDRAAGKRAYRTKLDVDEIVEGIVKTLRDIPDNEPVLIVTFKPAEKGADGKLLGNKIIDLEPLIKDMIPAERFKTLRFLTWGRHTATNMHVDCKHVVLTSLYQFAPATYEAMTRGARDMGLLDALDLQAERDTKLSEIMHHTFQAASRGATRKAVNESCPEGCTLYVIFSTHHDKGVPRATLSKIFPLAKVSDWLPVDMKLNPREKQVIDIARKIVDTGSIPRRVLAGTIGLPNAKHIDRYISERVKERLAFERIKVVPEAARQISFQTMR